MRELKVRVWDKKESEWLILGATGIDCLNGELVDYEYEGYALANQENYIIEQYTGLKDKNGKEIYEGDIIQEKGLLSFTCVEWDKNNARYITKVLDKSKCVASVFYFDIIDALECEVIGNIHENPELLSESKAA